MFMFHYRAEKYLMIFQTEYENSKLRLLKDGFVSYKTKVKNLALAYIEFLA